MCEALGMWCLLQCKPQLRNALLQVFKGLTLWRIKSIGEFGDLYIRVSIWHSQQFDIADIDLTFKNVLWGSRNQRSELMVGSMVGRICKQHFRKWNINTWNQRFKSLLVTVVWCFILNYSRVIGVFIQIIKKIRNRYLVAYGFFAKTIFGNTTFYSQR